MSSRRTRTSVDTVERSLSRDVERSEGARSSARSMHGDGHLDGSPAIPMYGHEGFEDRVFDPSDLRLVECQVGTWAGCVFINMDRGAPPLMEFLQPGPREFWTRFGSVICGSTGGSRSG